MGVRKHSDTSESPEESLFAAALERPEAERAAFLEQACAGDKALLQRVEALLIAHDATANPLATVQATFQPAEVPVFPSSRAETPGQTFGRYKLLEKIGEGGCGVVYVAEQTEPVRRRVALKIIKLGMDTKSVVARFEAERQALALMDHPNIAKVLDAGTTELGRPFFVMELVRGIRITDYCDQNRLSTQQRLNLFIKVCQAIQHAHQKGIIHRDIKPSNILVTLHDGEPVPKVIDFGIAKATEGRLTDATVYTQLHQFIGTPAYMSPEQAEMSGLDIDTRSDIYSLGVLLYEILTGQPPFDPQELMAQGLDGMRRTIREIEPARPSTRLATLSGDELTATAQRRSVESAKLTLLLRGDLDWIVMKCLEKDRSRRYETANGLAADLKRHLENEPVSARPPSTAYRLQKAWRRNRVSFTAGAFVLVSLTIALVQSVLSGHRTDAALQRAEAARIAEESQRRRAESAQSKAEQQRAMAEENQMDSRRRSYAAAVVLAQQALANDDLARARMLLLGQRPKSGELDLRGWEWRYLWGRTKPDEHSILVRKPTARSAVAVSHRGNLVASADMNGSIEVLNLKTGAIELVTIGSGYRGTSFRIMAFSPSEPWFAYNEKHPSGRHVVTVWDWEQRINRFQIEASRSVTTVAISSDGHHLGVLDSISGFSLYRMADGQLVRSTGFTNESGVCLALSADGRTQAIGLVAEDFSTGSLRILEDGGDIAANRSLLGSPGLINAAALNGNGSVLATGAFGVDTEIKLWDVRSGTMSGRLLGHRAYIHQLAFSPDNRWLASASADQTIRLWDWTNRTCLATLRGHLGEVWSVVFSPDGKTLYSASKDGTVRAWNVAGKSTRQTSQRTTRKLALAGFLGDGKTVVSVGTNSWVELWDGSELPPLRHLALPFTNASCARLSPDKQRILIGFGDGMLREWDLTSRQLLNSVASGEGALVAVGYRFSGGGWFGDKQGTVLVWESDLTQPPKTLKAHNRPMTVSSPVADVLVYHSRTGPMVLSPSAAPFQSLNLGQGAAQYAFSPDGKWLAGSAYDPVGMATLSSWPENHIQGEFRQHLLGAHGIAFSPDSRRLATGSTGRESIRLWDVATQMELVTLETETPQFGQIQFSPDGNRLAAMASNGEIHVWIAPTWEQILADGTWETTPMETP